MSINGRRKWELETESGSGKSKWVGKERTENGNRREGKMVREVQREGERVARREVERKE
jgi:hypothetical protein